MAAGLIFKTKFVSAGSAGFELYRPSGGGAAGSAEGV